MVDLTVIASNGHVHTALLAIAIGITIRAYMLHTDDTDRRIDKHHIIRSSIVAALAAVALVVPMLETVPDDAPEERQLTVFIAAIAATYALDSAGSKIAAKLPIPGRQPATNATTTTTVTATAVTPPMPDFDVPDFDIPEEPADDGNPPPKEAS